MSKTSRFYPYLKTIAKVLKIPGTEIGPSLLTDLQDDLSKGEEEEKFRDTINQIAESTGEIVQLLSEHLGVEASDSDVDATQRALAEAHHRKRIADNYIYADFKGIEQQQRFVSLELDDVFVNLKGPDRVQVNLVAFH